MWPGNCAWTPDGDKKWLWPVQAETARIMLWSHKTPVIFSSSRGNVNISLNLVDV